MNRIVLDSKGLTEVLEERFPGQEVILSALPKQGDEPGGWLLKLGENGEMEIVPAKGDIYAIRFGQFPGYKAPVVVEQFNTPQADDGLREVGQAIVEYTSDGCLHVRTAGAGSDGVYVELLTSSYAKGQVKVDEATGKPVRGVGLFNANPKRIDGQVGTHAVLVDRASVKLGDGEAWMSIVDYLRLERGDGRGIGGLKAAAVHDPGFRELYIKALKSL